MKTIIAVIITLVSMNVFAADIHGGYYDKASDNIVLNVTYQGGCMEHVFRLQLHQCTRSIPASCQARLIDNTDGDVCRGIVQKTVIIPASQAVGSYDIEKLLVVGDNETSAVIDFH